MQGSAMLAFDFSFHDTFCVSSPNFKLHDAVYLDGCCQSLHQDCIQSLAQ